MFMRKKILILFCLLLFFSIVEAKLSITGFTTASFQPQLPEQNASPECNSIFPAIPSNNGGPPYKCNEGKKRGYADECKVTTAQGNDVGGQDVIFNCNGNLIPGSIYSTSAFNGKFEGIATAEVNPVQATITAYAYSDGEWRKTDETSLNLALNEKGNINLNLGPLSGDPPNQYKITGEYGSEEINFLIAYVPDPWLGAHANYAVYDVHTPPLGSIVSISIQDSLQGDFIGDALSASNLPIQFIPVVAALLPLTQVNADFYSGLASLNGTTGHSTTAKYGNNALTLFFGPSNFIAVYGERTGDNVKGKTVVSVDSLNLDPRSLTDQIPLNVRGETIYSESVFVDTAIARATKNSWLGVLRFPDGKEILGIGFQGWFTGAGLGGDSIFIGKFQVNPINANDQIGTAQVRSNNFVGLTETKLNLLNILGGFEIVTKNHPDLKGPYDATVALGTSTGILPSKPEPITPPPTPSPTTPLTTSEGVGGLPTGGLPDFTDGTVSDAISDLTTNDPGTIQSFTDAVNVINAINNNSYPSESQTRSINIGGGPSFPVSARTQAAAGVLALTAAGSDNPKEVIRDVSGNLRISAATSGAKDSAVNPFAVDPVYSAVTGNESLANMNSVLGTSPENPFMGFAFQSINLVTPKVNWENWESFVNGLLGLTFGIGNENKGLRDLLFSDFAGKKQDIIRKLAEDPKREEYYQSILSAQLSIFLGKVAKCIDEEKKQPAQCTHEAGGEMGKELENEWKEKEKNKLGTENERKFRNQMAANFYVIQLNMESQNLYSPEAAADETTFTGWY